MSSLLSQIKILTWKNFLVNKADKRNFYGEIFGIIVMIIFNTILCFTGKDSNVELKTYNRTEPININQKFQQTFVPTNDVYMGFVFPLVTDTNNNEKLTQYIMQNDAFKTVPQLKYKTFQNEKELEDFNNHENLLAGIIFSQNTEYNDYTIRMNRTFVPDPTLDPVISIEKLLDNEGIISGDNTEADEYLDYFVPIQMVVDEAIIQYKTNTSIHMNTNFGSLEIDANYIPKNSILVSVTCLYVVILSCYCIFLVIYITIEKETGLKKTLSLNGVSSFAYYFSWLSIIAVMFILVSIVVLIEDLITKSLTLELALLKFILTLLYDIDTVAIYMFVSLFFKSSQAFEKFNKYFAVNYYLLSFYINFYSMSVDIIALDIFIPSYNIFNIYREIYYCQRLKANVFEFMFSNNNKLLYYIIFSIFSFFLYTIATIIVDKKFFEENDSLIRKVKQRISEKKANKKNGSDNINSDSVDAERFAHDIEPTETSEKCMVEISDIVMQYKKEKSKNNGNENEISTSSSDSDTVCAVNHVSFKVYENEIFGILGHNGAGKSTLINIMTGLIHQNQGQIYYDGQEFFNNKEAIRKEFGICPQNCSLFENLTVEQNIIVFARLKEIEVNVDEILNEIDLSDKKYDIVGVLSGGQKKKLNVAIALMGNPKYVFLDEPSTGLDPFSRRKLWDLLKKNKQGKVIFLTTHYMDEADILTDRKLILHHGVIRCLGTSMYLKKHFNIMYHLKVESDHYSEAFQLIQSHIPDVIECSKEQNQNEIVSDDNNSSEVYTFKLPTDSSCKLPILIEDLEKQVENKTIIQNFSISLPSLEELFIQLNSENNSTSSIKSLDKSDRTPEEESVILIEKKTKLPRYENITKPSDNTIIRSLVSHKFKIYFKSKAFIFYAFIVPLIFSILIFIFHRLLYSKSNKTEYSAEVLDFNKMYNDTLWNYDISASNVDEQIFKSGFGSQVKTFDIKTMDNIGKNITSKDTFYSISISANLNDTNYFMDVYYNKTMPHSPPTSFNAISNSILQSKNSNEKITVSSQPFSVNNSIKNEMISILFSAFIAFVLMLSISSYGLNIVKEKAKGLKKQLFLNQVNNKCYWLSSIIIDSSIYMISCLIFIIIGLILRCEALYHIWSLVMIILIIIVGAAASISNQYVLSLMFKKEITAQTFLPLINMFLFGLGFSFFSGFSTLKMINIGNSTGFSTTLIIVSIIYSIIYPPFSLIIGFNQLFNYHLYHELYGNTLNLGNYFKFNTGFIPIIISLIVAYFIYYFILLKVDSKKTDNQDIPKRIKDMMDGQEIQLKENDELYEELENVKKNKNIMPISLFHIVKEFRASIPSNKKIKKHIKQRMTHQYGEIHCSTYGRGLVRTVIEDVTFGVKEKECFGLLGPNGVGKSTLLNTIIQKYLPTAGEVYFNGVKSSQTDNIIGYCPQENILWDELSILEHLEFYLRIRGVSKDKVKEYALQYIDYCQLTEHMNKPVRKLSGGTKRKLSLLIAICAYPLQIILDEPTAGVDPATRIFIWNLIKEIRETGKSSIIMTTHSMEEAQELCNRLTILINGRLVCIGSPEYLRMKYGSSYFLEIQSEHQKEIHQMLFDKEVGAFSEHKYKLENLSNHRYKYEIEMKKGLGKLFEIIEKAKTDGLVTEYTLSQSNLEQVFIDFTKQFKNN